MFVDTQKKYICNIDKETLNLVDKLYTKFNKDIFSLNDLQDEFNQIGLIEFMQTIVSQENYINGNTEFIFTYGED